MMISKLQRLPQSLGLQRLLVNVGSQRSLSSDTTSAPFFPGATVHCRGDLPYGSREYVLLAPHTTLEDIAEPENAHLKLASLQAHRNIIFGAKLHYQPKYIVDEEDDDEFDESKRPSLSSVCLPLLDAALVDAGADAEQPQAISTLHGLSVWVATCMQGRCNSDTYNTLQGQPESSVALQAAQSIATNIPRKGHSVVGQGTYRDGATVWEQFAREFVAKKRSEECQLYQARGGELVGIDLLADTKADYLRSAGGSMARFFFV